MHIALTQAETRLPTPDGKRFVNLFNHGSLQVELYAPRGTDPQQPHSRDEIYVVARGHGIFLEGDRRIAFEPGDFLFVPARIPHRFEQFSDDLTLWVMFYGPEGGEKTVTSDK
jgi:mannose-6-phosphate isomerase-like protein (cupin superfamily)